ncbi:MAG: winged helix DNA-binding domain-containing protein [Rubrobacter sp.]|nr:winged helix DNA-binding domain-containing protein [Rubrobacter sp.]
MTDSNIVRRRLENQLLAHPGAMRPDEIVRWFGAVQAQDLLPSLWALGVRIPGSTETEMERAVDEGKILRTWPMRGTIHYVPAEDARWMLGLMTPRIIARSASRYRELDLDESAFDHARSEIYAVLEGGGAMPRPELMSHLESRRVSTKGQRGYHILCHLAQEGFLCFGPREGKQPTIVLLDEWAPEQRSLDRGEALAEIAGRYFRSHGPATLHDFAWWTGLTVADCRVAMDSISSMLEKWEEADRTLWFAPADDPPQITPSGAMLLPFVDEYMVGYTDRRDFLKPEYSERTFNGLMATVFSDGEIVGMWKRKLSARRAVVSLDLFRKLDPDERSSLDNVLRRYGDFLGLEAELADE